jgi:hypothetical protein
MLGVMKRRSLKSRFAFLHWTASVALAWPVLSSALFPAPEPVSVSIGPHWCRTPAPPSVLDLLASRHRPFKFRPDGRIVI